MELRGLIFVEFKACWLVDSIMVILNVWISLGLREFSKSSIKNQMLLISFILWILQNIFELISFLHNGFSLPFQYLNIIP